MAGFHNPIGAFRRKAVYKNELIFFMASFTGHIQKLEMLYIAAYTYLINTFQEKCDEDELLAWTINHIYDSMSF